MPSSYEVREEARRLAAEHRKVREELRATLQKRRAIVSDFKALLAVCLERTELAVDRSFRHTSF